MVLQEEKLHSTVDKYEAKDFSYFFETLDGFSEKQLKLHYGLYEGYIKKVNEVNEKLKSADRSSANHNYSEYRNLLVDLSHNLNGVILHELYFSNLTDKHTEASEIFKKIAERDFESFELYLEDLKAAGMASRAGWAITGYNYRDGKIYNFAIDQHNLHVPVFVRPLLVLDTWEHAFGTDYGTDKKSYIDAFMKIINWHVVSLRFESVLKDESCDEKSD
ncbi:MAG: Fe-Mn family superoxide dismutase [bacterium]